MSRTVGIVALAAALVGAMAPGTGEGAQARGAVTFKVGFIYVGPKDDYGYNYEHDRGRKAVEAAFKGM